jgi:hypothetical protein
MTKSSTIGSAFNPRMGKCISGLSGDPICPYGDLGVERVVLLVRRSEKSLEPCCAARHPAAHDIIAAVHCVIDVQPP